MDKYKELYDSLSEDLKTKAANCKTGEELVALAQSEGIELTDDQLDAISGGSDWSCSCYCDCQEDVLDPNGWS